MVLQASSFEATALLNQNRLTCRSAAIPKASPQQCTYLNPRLCELWTKQSTQFSSQREGETRREPNSDRMDVCGERKPKTQSRHFHDFSFEISFRGVRRKKKVPHRRKHFLPRTVEQNWEKIREENEEIGKMGTRNECILLQPSGWKCEVWYKRSW
jgi:hypothetical protein